jgi:hypothetical protein
MSTPVKLIQVCVDANEVAAGRLGTDESVMTIQYTVSACRKDVHRGLHFMTEATTDENKKKDFGVPFKLVVDAMINADLIEQLKLGENVYDLKISEIEALTKGLEAPKAKLEFYSANSQVKGWMVELFTQATSLETDPRENKESKE